MSDRDDRRVKRVNEQQPVIPDGGLSSSMPSWLTERPRWAEVPSREASPAVKQLPPPDTSPIELASILEVADLPVWLQDVARRAERREVDAVPATGGEPELESPDNRGSDVLVDAEDPVQALERQPELTVDSASEEQGSGEGELTVGPSAEDDVEAQVAADDVEVERPALDVAESATVAPEDDAVSSGGIGGQRVTARREPVDWAAVRQEAESSEQEPPAATNPLLAQNPPVRVDPTTARRRSSHSRNAHDRPWWMSDTAIGVLLVAVILTMIYVILVASGVL